MTYRAVVFDLDGTLLNTIDDLADAMNAALAANALPTHPNIADHKYFVGDGVLNYVLRVLPAELRDDQALIERVIADYRRRYGAGWAIKTRPYAGVPELLDRLVAAGMRLAVLSNKPDDFTRQTVEHFLGMSKFELTMGAVSDLPLKPDPASALEVARRMRLAPAECLYLGDTATDMKTAVGAGMYPVGALWGFRTAEELVSSGARALIGHPMDLMGLVGR